MIYSGAFASASVGLRGEPGVFVEHGPEDDIVGHVVQRPCLNLRKVIARHQSWVDTACQPARRPKSFDALLRCSASRCTLLQSSMIFAFSKPAQMLPVFG